MLRTALTGVAVLVAFAVSAPAAGAGPLVNLTAQEEARYADGLVRVAMEMVGERHRACRPRPTPPPTFVDDAPSAQLLSRLALLRRPPIPQDALAVDSPMLRYVAAKDVYRNWHRMGRAADGVELYVLSAREAQTVELPSRACLRKRHAQLLRLLRDEDRRTGVLALRAERRADREARALRSAPGEHLFLFERTNGGLGLGGRHVSIDELEQHGLLSATMRRVVASPDLTHVVGLFPDGVASVELVYPRRAERSRFESVQIYESELRLTVPVQDNLVSFWVEREGPEATQPTMTWRAADGSVLRITRAGR